MAESENKIMKRNKKWHEHWWGIVFLLVIAVLLLYLAVFIYQVVMAIEVQKEAVLQNSNLLQNLTPQVNAKDLVETADDPYWGPEDAKLVIVEFGDFQCPYCLQAYPIMKQIRNEYSDRIKLIFRDFPNIASHPDAINAALAADCANEQGQFWPYHDQLFDNQKNLSLENLKLLAAQINLNSNQFNDCLDNKKYMPEIQDDMQDGLKLGISGTPTFFINGIKVPGVIPYETLKLIIDKSLSLQ